MNWATADATMFGAKQTQTAFLLTTDTGSTVAPDAMAGQMDLFAGQAPVWVQVCEHTGCVLTTAHEHGWTVDEMDAELAPAVEFAKDEELPDWFPVAEPPF